MAEKISVEIDLEGGAEVETQLQNIGKAGQQAFGDIQNAADQVNLGSATEQIAEFGNAGQAAFAKIQTAAKGAVAFEQIIQGIKKVEGAFETLGGAAEKVALRMTRSLGVLGVVARALGPVGIALGAAGGAFVKFGNDAAAALNDLTGAAAKLGQTPQQLDTLQKALARVGVAPDAIISGLEKLRESLGGAFSSRDLERFIIQIERMPDGVARTQLAMEKLGDALGTQVISGLQTGAITAQSFAAALGEVRPATQAQIVEAGKYQQALNQLGEAWTELKGAFTPILTPIFGLLTQELQNLKKDLEGLRLQIAFAKAVWDVFTASITGQDVGEAARKAAQEYKQLETQLTETAQAGQQVAQGMGAVAQATAQTGQQLQQTGQTGEQAGQQVTRSWDLLAQEVTRVGQVTEQTRFQFLEAGQTAAQGWSGLAQEVTLVGQALDQTGNEAAQAGQEGAQGVDAISNALMTGLQVIQQYQAALRELAFFQNLQRPTSVTQGLRPDALAGGGMIGGSGSGTSDSNLAWVSRGEYITPARAVAQPGVLGFLEALRRSGGNLRGVLDGMSRFALGGLVPRTIPAFAAGGPVGSMSHVTINFPGTPPISGLRASTAVVEQLQRAAVLAQVRSGGRKPSRYS